MSDSEGSYHSDETDSESGSEIEGINESAYIKLSSIKTIKQLYEEGVLKATAKAASSPSPSASAADGASAVPAAPATAAQDSTASAPADSTTTDASSADPVKKPEEEETKTYEPNAGFLERVSLFQGDITKLLLDAIVNAANKSLLGGGGVDGAIHAAAGPKLLAECRQLHGAQTGESKITRGYNLPAGYVIHTVGPVYSASQREEKAALLKSCYKTSLQVAVENQLKHVAFPSVSTGIYGYPIADATHVALRTVREFLETPEGDKLERVVFVVWSNKDKETYEELIPEYFPPAIEAPKE